MPRYLDDPTGWWRSLKPYQRFLMRHAWLIAPTIVQTFSMAGLIRDSVLRTGWASFNTVSLLVVATAFTWLITTFFRLFWMAWPMVESNDPVLKEVKGEEHGDRPMRGE